MRGSTGTKPVSAVSVVVPTFNRSRRIVKTLDSILAQTCAPLEILVIDDGSSDDTADFIEVRYGDLVRVIRQPNLGVAKARNRGLEEANGEFIAFLDHDDIWLPRKLELQVRALQENPDAAFVWSKWREVDEKGTPIATEKHLWAQPFWRGRSGRVFQDFIPKNLILSASVPLIRTSYLRAVRGFDAKTTPSDDWDLWLRLSKKYATVFLDEILVDYFWHDSNQSKDDLKMWRASQRALIKHWPALWKRPRAFWLVVGYSYFLKTVEPFYQNARRAVAVGDWRGVKTQMWAGFRRHPFLFLTAQWVYLAILLLRRNAKSF